MAFTVNVPNVLGVPSVLFGGLGGGLVSLLIGDAVALFAGALGISPWGIYFGGIPVVLADNVAAFSYKRGATIADYPIEGGAFVSYDKVQMPFDARFTFTAGGSQIKRQAFLAGLEALVGDTNTYNVVTPDAVYVGVNIVNVDYQRSAQNGVGLITANVWALQVRTAPLALLSSVIDAGSASQVNGGTSQAVAATSVQSNSIPIMLGE
jgi:hypothetical protein